MSRREADPGTSTENNFDYAEYERMNRADIKRRDKIDRYEKSFGHDEVIWEQIDDKGVHLKQGLDAWFVTLPNDELMDHLYQTQNQFFRIAAKIRECEDPTLLKKLRILLSAKNDLIEQIQDLLSR